MFGASNDKEVQQDKNGNDCQLYKQRLKNGVCFRH